jgi:hypothetical protein
MALNKTLAIIGATGAAALIAVGGSAFTAANTGGTTALSGYGATTASGVAVQSIVVTPAADPNFGNVDTIVYTVASVGGYLSANADITIDPGGTPVSSACTFTDATTITCSPTVTVADLEDFALTVSGATTD